MADEINLGWIPPSQRTEEQAATHEAIVKAMPRFAVAAEEPTGPISVRLFDYWKHPDVLADVGFVFPRFHQITGSCVGAGGGNALFTLIAVQRVIGDTPTKAFVPWWPFNYGKSRLRFGWKNPGEGSFGSTFAKSLTDDGVLDSSEPGLPKFTTADGLTLTKSIEMAWSDGDTSTAMSYNDEAIKHPLGTAAELKTLNDSKIATVNGYPQAFACTHYVGRASVKGSGANAAVVGKFDTFGPHQVSIHAYWDNPELGPLVWQQNNWPASIYPTDPAGGPPGGCWVQDESFAHALKNYEAELFAFSHLAWFPAQPKVLRWLIAP